MRRRSFIALSFLAGYGVFAAGSSTPLIFGDDRKSQKNNSLFVFNQEYDIRWAEKYNALSELIYGIPNPTPLEKFVGVKDKLLENKILRAADLNTSAVATIDDLGEVHELDYILKTYALACSGVGALKFDPIIPKLIEFFNSSVGGTYLASEIALEKGAAMNLSGGFHHAFPDHDDGFCYFNDVAIAIKKLQAEKKIEKAMIVDCDVHHGNGNAYIFRKNPSVTIFDIYQEDNYPAKKVDVEFPVPLFSEDEIGDERYIGELQILPHIMRQYNPDIIFYLAGADPYEHDKLGKFLLTKEGLAERDEFIIKNSRDLGIPIAIVTAGGYAQNPQDVIDIHYNTARILRELF
ncbi:histone deacetylase [Nanoarchaeota archaeon]